MCFDDALDGFDAYLKANRGLSANTRRAYRSDVEECLVALRKQGCVDLNEVTIEDLRLWMAKSSKNHARSSMARKTVAVRGFFAWAYDHDMASANPAASLQTPKIPDTLPAVLNETQAQQLMDRVDEDGMKARSQEPNMKKHAIALRDAAMLELLYATGMRVAELVGLDVADVTFGNRTVKVTGKGDRSPRSTGKSAIHGIFRRPAYGSDIHRKALRRHRQSQRTPASPDWRCISDK